LNFLNHNTAHILQPTCIYLHYKLFAHFVTTFFGHCFPLRFSLALSQHNTHTVATSPHAHTTKTPLVGNNLIFLKCLPSFRSLCYACPKRCKCRRRLNALHENTNSAVFLCWKHTCWENLATLLRWQHVAGYVFIASNK